MPYPPIQTRAGGLQEPIPVREVSGDDAVYSLGYMQVPLSTTLPFQLPDIPDGAKSMLIKPESGGIRYRDDGIDPTSTVGMPLASGESMYYELKIEDLRMIAQEDGAICNIAFYGTDL